MPDSNNPYDDTDEDLPPSKSAIKRQMTALQKLGESLLELNEKQLQQIPLGSESLQTALAEAKRISSNSARKRHLQYIGKLMREIDPEPIQAAMDAIYAARSEDKDAFHQLEQLRDQLLEQGDQGIQAVIEQWPQAERQQLRQLLLQHQRELQRNKPLVASRKLFQYLRELQAFQQQNP
ncbi:MAG: ribosome-associated protein [Halieaceae bacterium]|jgi:ribosome-associated protein